MGFLDQIRKLNVEGYAKGGKAEKDTSRGPSTSSRADGKTPGPSSTKSQAVSGPSVDKGGTSGGGGFFGFTSLRDMFDGGGPGASAPTGGDVRVPTPRPSNVSIVTADGRRDVSFQDYADIARNPTGARAQALNYVQPAAMPALEPEFEAAINAYMQPREPGLLERGLRMMPLGGILGAMSDFTRQTIQDQLTTPVNYYEGTAGPGLLSGIGRFATRPGENVASYTPVLNENGQLIGSMALDASGNPVSYTGTRTTNATFGDPNINRDAALAMMSPFQGGDGGGDNNQMAMAQDFQDPCPEGYSYDEETRSCVPDVVTGEDGGLFDQPWSTPTPAPVITPAPNYTAVTPIAAPTLTPGPAAGLNFQTTPVQPIGFGPQMGLGSFAPRNV